MTAFLAPLLLLVTLTLIGASSKLVLVWLALRESKPHQRPQILDALGQFTREGWSVGPLSRGRPSAAGEAGGPLREPSSAEAEAGPCDQAGPEADSLS